MKKLFIALALCGVLAALPACGNGQLLGDKKTYVQANKPLPTRAIQQAGKYPPHSRTIWITPSALPPDVEYEVLEQLKVKPKWGGTVRKVEAKMADRARALGADMIIKEDIAFGHTMFGASVPVGRAEAIKLKSSGFDPKTLAGGWF